MSPLSRSRARVIFKAAGGLLAAVIFCAFAENEHVLFASATSTTTAHEALAAGSKLTGSATAEAQLVVERAALASVARDLALALHDPALRVQLKDDLRASRFTREHKLPLQTYLSGRGTRLLSGMAHATAKEPSGIVKILKGLRRLEIYMPVPAHRESWAGEENLIVAWQLIEEEAPAGYRTDGSEVMLSNDSPPSLPTIVIVPAESDFSKPLSNSWQNTRDRGGNTIGTYAHFAGVKNALEGAVAYPSGVYLKSAHLRDDGESWARGQPEIEAFVIAPTFYIESQGELIRCAGQGAPGARHFDQNTADWYSSDESVLGQFLTRAEVDHYYDIYNAPYSILFWEDDQDACEVVDSDRSEIEQLFGNLRAAARATTLIISILNERITLNPGAGNALRAILPLVWQSDDDFLGNVVYRPGSRYTRCSNTYIAGDLETPQGNNGWVEIHTVEPSSDEPPVASFVWQCTGLDCTFYSTSSDCSGISAWSWDFGDGTTHSESVVYHTFPFEGTFTVSLTVTDTAGQTNQRVQPVAVHVITCGDSLCESGESSINCPDDCGTCGNFVCDPDEDSYSCPGDCAVCGNFVCEPGEDYLNCSSDCCVPGECQ